MQLTIIKKNKLNVFVLPKKITGTYWITDFENGRKINLLSVEAINNQWELISNEDTFVIDQNKNILKSVTLKECSFYLIKNNNKDELYYLYCSPVYDQTYKELNITDTIITIGKSQNCTICYNFPSIPQKAFTIIKSDKNYYLNIDDIRSSVYINQKRIIKTKKIEYGDVIFTYGLKIILMRKENNDYLLVNNPNNLLEPNPSYKDIIPKKDNFIEDFAELSNDSIYHEDNYFYRTPHFYKTLKPFKLTIDNPPEKKEGDKTPAILTIGPMFTMGMTSLVMLITTVQSVNDGTRTINEALTSIVMSVAMLGSCLLWPLITKIYQNHANKRYERKREKVYQKYLNEKENEIKLELEMQKKIITDNNFSVTNCQNIIEEHKEKLWQKRINDDDFLTLPVGIGWTPMQIEIKYPEKQIAMDEDKLLQMAQAIGQKQYIINNVPITFSFYENKTLGIVGDSITTKEFIDRLILQMMTHYSYDELKIVTLTAIENETDWDYIKILPHSWSNDKQIRYFGSSNDDYREIIYSLEKIYKERLNKNDDEKSIPHYVIITDAIKSIDTFDFIKEIMATPDNYGFSIIILVDQITALPNECKNFINVSREECTIYNSIINKQNQTFKIDFSPIDNLYNCAMELSNIPIDINSEVEGSLPDIYYFLEMFQVGKIEQLNSKDRWKKNNPVLSLQAPIGIGKSGEVINLDIHEKYHGPHGLIAGTTGSGKSEFIISFILSLAINYHPYELQIILIDYKGGSLAGAFSNDLYSLPHLAGTITNLDGNELNRSLASIESEIKRRQKEFNEARKITNESTIDIYKYQRLWREGRLKNMDPIAHLIIISDEFAELKEQQPEFMEKLISVARVGRSLGIHLILATQKPGGVVDSQIWSNTRFRICLKVQDTADSTEILKKPDAAFLKKTGRFYLQVGYDEVYTLGQSAWTGGQYYPSTTFKKEIDTSVNTINNIGFITTTKDIDTSNKEKKSLGEELVNIVKYLSILASNENIKIKKLWLEKIPPNIFIDSLKIKYKFERQTFILNPIIGEYDDPSTQNQYVLNVPFTSLGNAIIYGITGSGKEMFLTSLIYSLISSYAANEVNIYILDFGSETLKCFTNSPYIGDILLINDIEKVKNLFKMLFRELENRKTIFANFGGSYTNYISTGKVDYPNIIIAINNYDAFLENFDNLNEDLTVITREAYKYGIYFVLTANSDNSLRLRTKQNFSLVYSLEQNNESDYYNIFGNIHGKAPAKYKGRGLFKKDNIYEFQTAQVAKENATQVIQEYCTRQQENLTYRAKKIPALPKIVDYDFVKDSLEQTPNIIIGVSKNDLNIEKYNFKKNIINIISAKEFEDTYNFVTCLIKEINFLQVYNTILINTTEETLPTNCNKIYTNNFNEAIDRLGTYIDSIYQIYENNQFDNKILNEAKNVMVFVYGAYDFINKLNIETKLRLKDIITKDSNMNLITFILIDSEDLIKNFTYDDWFKEGTDLSRGIWIGNGITEQLLFKVTKYEKEDREDISNKFGYMISNHKLTQIKLLDSFNPHN